MALPAARNAAGQQVSTTLNYVLVQFANTQAYTNYLVVFPPMRWPTLSVVWCWCWRLGCGVAAVQVDLCLDPFRVLG